MKKVFKVLIFIFPLSVVFISCDREMVTYSGAEYVRFSDEDALSMSESSTDTTELEIHFVGNHAPASDITLTIVNQGNAVEGYDFDFIGTSTPTISAGDYFTSISFILYDNLEADGSRTIEFVISDADGYQIGYGGDSTEYAIGEAVEVTIGDDDCTYDVSNINGTLSGTDVTIAYADGTSSISSYTSEASFTYVNSTTIEVTNLGVPWVSGFWGEDVESYYPFEMTVNENGLDLTIDPQVIMQTIYNDEEQDPYTIEGFGTIDACEQTLTIEYTLINYETDWADYCYSSGYMEDEYFTAILNLP